ncbi:MAG: phosphonate C-P lyase system protein PhnG [Rhodobiaceae bacterium]|nr:phosphonate C-P lyase system protein PhnG [Rhodobiaceae bacterium]MCC0057379.1 phosphonate C-P lyase system protein PhnG [Rhodobiaceae bacterium]
MRIFSLAPAEALRSAAQNVNKPAYERLRGPETGLVMLRGRTGGGGEAFNVGEATVTRCSVRLASGEVGHAYILGRDGERAECAAWLDGLWQNPATRATVEDRVLAPLAAAIAAEERTVAAKSARTKVEFFTMVRGED